ncbi:hypothetical protein SUGI_0768870 [Cryptomeria japonica]|nr:hypothetical protein SUGI_0768870 [Cryptomeria japonica]
MFPAKYDVAVASKEIFVGGQLAIAFPVQNAMYYPDFMRTQNSELFYVRWDPPIMKNVRGKERRVIPYSL